LTIYYLVLPPPTDASFGLVYMIVKII